MLTAWLMASIVHPPESAQSSDNGTRYASHCQVAGGEAKRYDRCPTLSAVNAPADQNASGRRLGGFVLVFGFFCAAVVLLWSDRAGSMLGDVASLVVRGGRKVERSYDVDLVDRSDIPGQTDQIVHALFWGSGMMLVGWLLRRRVAVVLTAFFVGGVSVLFEAAQPALSQTRAVEPSDALANMVGVAGGAVVIYLAIVVWRLVSKNARRPGTPQPGLPA